MPNTLLADPTELIHSADATRLQNLTTPFRLARLLLREHICAAQLNRRPEPEAMDKPASVAAFHQQGRPGGALLPLYHFNALALSRLIPPGGSLLDLGSGSGQFLAHLARVRPDISITGLDLSTAMVELGNDSLRREGLSARVKLRLGDMTNFGAQPSTRISAISCVFALHHLPTVEQVSRCLTQIAAVRESSASAVWIFDHVRPRHLRTAEEFPEIFTPSAPATFRQDSRNSLIAAHSFEELSALLNRSGIADLNHTRSRILPFYQVHFSTTPYCACGHSTRDVAPVIQAAFQRFRKLLNDVPLCACGSANR